MKNNSGNRKKVGRSIEDYSVLRKFTILFLIMSILPTLVLFYFYIQIKDQGSVQISAEEYNVMMIFVALGVLLGYGTMRRMLISLVQLADANRKALENFMSPDKFKSISGERNEIAVLAETFSAITERLEENVKSLELTKRTLHSVMAKVGQGIASMQNIDSFLDLILETATDALSGEVGVLMIKAGEENKLQLKTIYGISKEEAAMLEVRFDLDFTRSVLESSTPRGRSRKIAENNDIKKLGQVFIAPSMFAALIVHDQLRGFIAVCGRKVKDAYSDDEYQLMTNIATQTAVAIENSQLSSDMEATYFETISALALAVDAKDKYSRGHLDRVAGYCMMIAKKLGLEKEDIKTLRDAARIHDIGKIGIPDEILGKKGPLNHQEWALMKRHPEIGESIIKPIRSLNHLCDLVRHHHEKIDGSGYPDQLKGDEITPLVRILTIADIFDALTTDRPYREKFSFETACAKLREMAGDGVDADIVEAFIETLGKKQPLI